MTIKTHDLEAFHKDKMDFFLHQVELVSNDSETAKKELTKLARQLIDIIPHTASFWFEAKKNDAKEDSRYKTIISTIREEWKKQNNLDSREQIDNFHLVPDSSSFENLPPFSFILKFKFKLRKPYLSKDDDAFYLIDNPVRKEKIFMVPMVASTSWKGALRYAFWQTERKEYDEVVIRLFGNPIECNETEEFQTGRLHFYPSFFEKKGFDIINPHDRQTGKTTDRGPILFEAVRLDQMAEFTLTYIPIFSNVKIRRESAEDLKELAAAIYAMMTKYGFGAKTSSGFGVAHNKIDEGELVFLLPEQGDPFKETFNSLTDLVKVTKKICVSIAGGEA